MELTYLGTNSLVIKKGGSTLLVDPHFTRPGLLQLLGKIRPDANAVTAGLDRMGIQHFDGIILTHTHYDHALDTPEILHQAGGVQYGSKSALFLAQGACLRETTCVQVAPGEVYPIGAFDVSFHPSRHIAFPAPFGWLIPQTGEIHKPLHLPAWFWEFQCGDVYAIQVDQTLIFGSAGFESGTYQNLVIETVVLGIGGLDMMPEAYVNQLYTEAVLLPGAKQVFLSHWDNFFRPAEQNLKTHNLARRSIEQIRSLGVRYGQSVHLLDYGHTLTI